MESGRLTFEQELGQFTLSVYGAALKYGYFRGLTSSYGSAALSHIVLPTV